MEMVAVFFYIPGGGCACESAMKNNCTPDRDAMTMSAIKAVNRFPLKRLADAAGNRESMEVRSLSGQAIDVWCLDIRMAMATQLTPAPVVSENKQDVRLFGLGSRAGYRHRKTRKYDNKKRVYESQAAYK